MMPTSQHDGLHPNLTHHHPLQQRDRSTSGARAPATRGWLRLALPRPRLPFRSLLVLLVTVLLLALCEAGVDILKRGTSSSVPNMFDPPELQVPGVVHLASVAQLQRRLGQQGQAAAILNFTPYLAAPAAPAAASAVAAAGTLQAGERGGETRAVRVLVELFSGEQPELYDLALDGDAADARRLSPPAPCTGRLAVTESGT